MTKQHSESSVTASPFPWLAELNGSALSALTRTGECCGKACVEWQQEVARFTTARLQSDSQVGQQLLACQNWADAAKVQSDWIASLMRDYADEANRLVQLASKLGADLTQARLAETRSATRHQGLQAAE